jgi:ribosome-associated translation inhibitor RaiA
LQTPLQLTLRSMAHSDALAEQVQRRVDDLEYLYDHIVSCHVVVELAGHHHEHGDRFRVAIDVGLPGHELVINHERTHQGSVESAEVVTHQAFDEAARQLQDWVKRRRTSHHEEAHWS